MVYGHFSFEASCMWKRYNTNTFLYFLKKITTIQGGYKHFNIQTRGAWLVRNVGSTAISDLKSTHWLFQNISEW